jgi:uncharacterized protein YecE (DUF72 family)
MDLQLGLFPDEPASRTPAAVVAPATVAPELIEIAGKLPANLRLGTSSWSFPGWDGIVYDRRTSQRVLAQQGLSAYAEHPLLRTVGVDRTFYRPIPAEDFRRYADVVPAGFRFLVKADRILTSPHELEGFGVRATNPRFLDARYAIEEVVAPVIEGLGPKAGPILFQFPPIAPNLVGGRGQFVERLQAFLAELPVGPTYAVEIRTPAFLTEEYADALRSVDAAHCFTVHPAMASLDRQLALIQSYQQPALVVRWMLHSGLQYEAAKERYEPFDRIVDADSDSRDRIAVAVMDALIAERDVFVIANNKAEGSAPLTVFELARRIATWEDAPR